MGTKSTFPSTGDRQISEPSTVAPENGWLEDGVSFWGNFWPIFTGENVSSVSVIDGLGPCGLDS